MPAYDPNNIFAKIIRGEIPCHKVYEDEKALAFLDIMPRAPGHALVIPKAAARNILDVSADDLAHVMKIAQRIAKLSVNTFGADGVTLQPCTCAPSPRLDCIPIRPSRCRARAHRPGFRARPPQCGLRIQPGAGAACARTRRGGCHAFRAGDRAAPRLRRRPAGTRRLASA